MTIDYTTTDKQPSRYWSNKGLALYHYFNDSGLHFKKKCLNSKISYLVKADKLPSGWIVAHGSLNSYAEDALFEITQMKRVNRRDLRIALSMLQMEIDHTKEALSKEGYPSIS